MGGLTLRLKQGFGRFLRLKAENKGKLKKPLGKLSEKMICAEGARKNQIWVHFWAGIIELGSASTRLAARRPK